MQTDQQTDPYAHLKQALEDGRRIRFQIDTAGSMSAWCKKGGGVELVWLARPDQYEIETLPADNTGPSPAGKLTDERLAEIGRQAARINQEIDIFQRAERATTSFARAVREAVEKEQGGDSRQQAQTLFEELLAKKLKWLTGCEKGDAEMSKESSDAEVTNYLRETRLHVPPACHWILNTAALRLGESITKDAKQAEEIARLTAKFEACDQARKNACDDRDTARAELATAEEQLKAIKAAYSEWKIGVGEPTDSDFVKAMGCILGVTYAPTAEEASRAEFEAAKASIPEFGNLWPRGVPMENEAALDDLRAKVDQLGLKVWQAARASKEVKA